MTFTIRGRLMIWYTLAFSAALLLVLGVLSLEIGRQLDDELSDILRVEEEWVTALVANSFMNLLTARGSEFDTLAVGLREKLEERYGFKRQFALLGFRRDGEMALFGGGLMDLERLFPVDFFAQPTGNYNLMITGIRFRIYLFRRGWGVIALGIRNETILNVTERAGQTLIWLVPLAMLLATAGGWLMAKLALRPVVAAARTAESISLANLQRRLPAYAGKDEFGALAATLNRMIARLEEGVKRLQQFTQDAAHELRTPLTILRGELELAYQDEHTSEEANAWLQRILDRVIELSQIVDNLMLLARTDSGDYPIRKTPFRLDAAIKEIFEDVQILAEGRPIAVHLRNGVAVEFVGDESLIRRLLLNLCDNALKYTLQGKIELSLNQIGPQIDLAISDTGQGIPAEDLPHIFDRFYRVDKARSSDTGGTGLGLAICRWIVSAHGGKIEVTSKLKKGTTVRVSLPAKPASD
ncbi:MAG: sensor histidine kinase [bacterium]